MKLQNERLFDLRERAVRRWLLPLLVVVVLVGFPAIWFGPRVYSSWQQGRLLRKARHHLENQQIAEAAICLRRVIALNRDNVEATRAFADLTETYLLGEALALRERVCQLAPGSYADATAWALTALRFGQSAQAEEAFDLMKKLGKPSMSFHEIGARVALAAGRVTEARAGFARALEGDPANASNQLGLAEIDIHSSDPAERQRATETLERLCSNPQLRHGVLRTLIGDRIERAQFTEALVLARDFVSDTETTFADRVQYLGLLRAKEDPSVAFTSSFNEKDRIRFSMMPESRDPSFASYLNDLQAEARGDAAKVAVIINFLNSRGLSLLACEWAGTMARDFVFGPPVAPPMAEAFRLTHDWRRLEEIVLDGNWGDVEFVRLAYCARVAQEKGDRGGVAAQWAAAVQMTEYRQERLSALGHMASVWGWSAEYEEILWTSVRSSKRPREALEELAVIARGKRDTQKLFNIYSRLLELDPAEVTARKNWVRLSLLLGNERYRTGSMAQELYQQHPADPEIAASYALVLHHRLQDAEALAVLSKLTPEQLRAPAIAGYHGVVLAANHRHDEATACLAQAREAPLLREEVALFDDVRRTIK